MDDRRKSLRKRASPLPPTPTTPVQSKRPRRAVRSATQSPAIPALKTVRGRKSKQDQDDKDDEVTQPRLNTRSRTPATPARSENREVRSLRSATRSPATPAVKKVKPLKSNQGKKTPVKTLQEESPDSRTPVAPKEVRPVRSTRRASLVATALKAVRGSKPKPDQDTDNDGSSPERVTLRSRTPASSVLSRKRGVKLTESKSPATPALKKGKGAKSQQDKKVDGNAEKGVLEWKFNVYGVPKCPLPCRETQFEEIWKFLFENITEKNSGCMYVSGVPGTGKTVIVQTVVDTMQKLTEDKKKDIKFQYLYINGLTLASPDKIWKRMFKGLGLPNKFKGISTKEALKRLDSHFESHQRDPVILVVDELDQILDKQQSILYQLLEWSSHARNMFSFVAIFNTMSLPENGLAMRNYSRIGFKRAVFPPYSYDQLHTIVSNMLSTFKTVRLTSECVSLLSRKVAAISGDARRALEIARRAMEIAESGNLSGIQAVSNAFKEIFSSAKIETIKYTSLLEQIILKAICDEIRCSGIEEVLLAKICEHVAPKIVYEGMNWPKDEILKAIMRLAVMRILIVEDNSTSIHKRVLLKVPVEDVNYALDINTDSV